VRFGRVAIAAAVAAALGVGVALKDNCGDDGELSARLRWTEGRGSAAGSGLDRRDDGNIGDPTRERPHG
jgi:hypothetical protein